MTGSKKVQLGNTAKEITEETSPYKAFTYFAESWTAIKAFIKMNFVNPS